MISVYMLLLHNECHPHLAIRELHSKAKKYSPKSTMLRCCDYFTSHYPIHGSAELCQRQNAVISKPGSDPEAV